MCGAGKATGIGEASHIGNHSGKCCTKGGRKSCTMVTEAEARF